MALVATTVVAFATTSRAGAQNALDEASALFDAHDSRKMRVVELRFRINDDA